MALDFHCEKSPFPDFQFIIFLISLNKGIAQIYNLDQHSLLLYSQQGVEEMGYATCRACKGSGRYISKSGKAYDCKACGGSGVNRDWCETRCERCHGTITYKCDQRAPRFCKDCRNIQLERRCAQPGCDNTIRYNVGWDNVPTYCKRCETKRREGWSASTCPGTGVFGCGKLIWSPPGKKFSLCHECSEKKKASDAAKWKTKRCKGCGAEIKYHEDWDKVPDFCKECNAWQEKACATPGCPNRVKHKKHWENQPNFCDSCKAKQKEAKTNRANRARYRDEDVGPDVTLPGSNQTARYYGGDTATIRYYEDGYKHVTVRIGLGHGSTRYSYDVDPQGNYIPTTSHPTDQHH